MQSTAENDALDQRIEYDTLGADWLGPNDWRPYMVRVLTTRGPRAYRFPDRWSAREFAADHPAAEV